MSQGDVGNGLLCLQYMLLSKIMNAQGEEVPGILNAKNSTKFVDEPTIVFLKAVSAAYKERSLQTFAKLLETNEELIRNDRLLKTHLSALKNDLLEQNLVRIIEPFSRVEIERIATLIKLPEEEVLSKLSQMILDKKFRGILDQGAGELIVFDDPSK